MKNYQKSHLTGILLIVLGIIINSSIYNINILILILILEITGILFVTFGTIEFIGTIKPKVYRFIHQYKDTDFLDNITTIIGKLNKQDITRLRNQQGNKPIEIIFKRDPVLVDVKVHFKQNGWHHTQIVGWIYASDIDEAKRTLHYYNNWDNEEDNTPAFFDISQ